MGRPIDPKHLRIAERTARAMMRRLPVNVQVEDLEQAGVIGILDAMRRRPQASGVEFEWYVRCRIRGEILDELRRQDWAGRRRRSGPKPPVIVRFDDIHESWQELFAGQNGSAEADAIIACDAGKAWETPLPEREHRVMRARYKQGRRGGDVARDEGVSEPRISQIESRSLLAMRSHLTGQLPTIDVPFATRSQLWQARAGGKR